MTRGEMVSDEREIVANARRRFAPKASPPHRPDERQRLLDRVQVREVRRDEHDAAQLHGYLRAVAAPVGWTVVKEPPAMMRLSA
mgnify:CR=1 FL=1